MPVTKWTLPCVLALLFFACNAQDKQAASVSPDPKFPSSADTTLFTYDNFDERILTYQPERRPGVSERDYEWGLNILEETRSNTEGDPANLNEGDYWNLCLALINLGEPKAHVEIAFRKGTEDPTDFCAYKERLNTASFEEALPERFAEFLQKCKKLDTTRPENAASSPGVDPALLAVIRVIQEDDQKYRDHTQGFDQRQRALDITNQRRIDSLYQVYGAYLGRSLVGKEYETVMWAVIQHAEPEVMGKYLPVVHRAVEEGELGVGPLKMLLDRYYGLTEGYQFFGTQSGFGFEMADPERKEDIKSIYGIE